ncbi:MAG TPA: hypothetical protein VFJ58_02260 [Armatimonadota bacterium]|nr:hypothetical protein [Armatimonadota bacterium]
MTDLFADAGYWIALFDRRDRLHVVAMELSRSLPGRKIGATQVTLTEFLNYFAAFGEQFRQHVAETIRAMQQDPNIDVVAQAEDQFERALSLYALKCRVLSVTSANPFSSAVAPIRISASAINRPRRLRSP